MKTAIFVILGGLVFCAIVWVIGLILYRAPLSYETQRLLRIRCNNCNFPIFSFPSKWLVLSPLGKHRCACGLEARYFLGASLLFWPINAFCYVFRKPLGYSDERFENFHEPDSPTPASTQSEPEKPVASQPVVTGSMIYADDSMQSAKYVFKGKRMGMDIPASEAAVHRALCALQERFPQAKPGDSDIDLRIQSDGDGFIVGISVRLPSSQMVHFNQAMGEELRRAGFHVT